MGDSEARRRCVQGDCFSQLRLAWDGLEGVRFLCLSSKRLSKRPYRSPNCQATENPLQTFLCRGAALNATSPPHGVP